MQVYVRSFGCSANSSDSETIAGCLAKAGFTLADLEANADLLVYNTCAVKGPTENRIIQALKQVPKNKKLIVVGCLPKISFERLIGEVRFDGLAGAGVGEGIVDIARRVLCGEKVMDLNAVDSKPKLDLPHVRSNPIVSVLPINYGCLGSCSYCCVLFARGRLRSYSISEILDRVMADLAGGAREFWVTSQDTACYGREIGRNLAELLFALGSVEGDFKVRVGMMTPNMVTDMQKELIEAFRNEHIFKFLHLPVQSGDDEVLRRMRRFYSAKEFSGMVSAFKSALPDLTLATDVIVGFPGETKEAFKNTLLLLKQVKPDVTNVSKFFARPRTAAAEIQDGIVAPEEIKRRSAAAAELAKQFSFENNKRWVDWSGSVLIDEKGKVAGSWVGRNFAYKPIAVKCGSDLLGKTLIVKVNKSYQTYLAGTIVG
jgi:threonylcarbamoyladenosine tRNA methylthiotransferase CDKAL1